MNSFEFLNSKMFWFLSLIILFVVCFRYYLLKSESDLKKFAGALLVDRSNIMKASKLVLMCIAISFITFALTEPVWRQVPKKLKKEGRDLVFILDVSNSMKAEDLIPNRLEKAKILITECVNSLQNHRIGLVVFAGSSTIKCPLTLDYDFFLHILSRVDSDSVMHGGTLIEDAVLKTCDKLFTDSKNGNKDIILISDGGDLGKGVDKAIAAVNDIGAKIITIGLGDSVNGARIPLNDGSGFLKYKGKEVWTKLENEELKKFSKQCKAGAYLAAGTKQMDLAQIYEQFTQNEQGTSISEQEIMVYKDEYPIFLSLALISLFIMILLPSAPKKAAVKLTPLLLLFFNPNLKAATLSEADSAYENGKYEKAIEVYISVAHKYHDERALIYFNIANSYYRLGQFESAINSYRNTLSELDEETDLKYTTLYNLANALYKSAKEAEQPAKAVTELESALRYYRQIIMAKPKLKQAVINFELAKIELYKQRKADEEERKNQEEIQQKLAEIRKLLEKAIAEQTTNIEATENLIQKKELLNSLKAAEEIIFSDSDKAQKLIEDLEKKDDSFKEMKVFEASLSLLKNAIINEKAAIDFLSKNNDSALPSENEALNKLKRALDELPKDPQQQSSDDGESDDDGEYSEDEEEEEGEEGEDSMNPDSSTFENKQEQSMELPNVSVEEILKMEDALHKMREAAGKKGRSKKVDKDW